jgi:hypothetical protein
MSVPKRSACLRMVSISTGTVDAVDEAGIVLGPAVVSMSWPPDESPVNISGARFARAAYTAAVYPAGPDPMMMTLRRRHADPLLLRLRMQDAGPEEYRHRRATMASSSARSGIS